MNENFAEETRKLKKPVCPQCGKEFELSYDEYDKPETLRISSCLSGGIYTIVIRCPHCRYTEEIK